MKSRLSKIISCIIVISLLLISVSAESSLFERKDSKYKYAPFFEHADDIDVFFLGSSHAVNTEYPMELWKDYGITSYNLAGDGNALATTYWVFENALDHATPKVVFVDCFLLSNNDKSTIKFEYVHTALDAFPLSYTKYRAAKDFTEDAQRDIYVEENSKEVTGEKPSVISLLWDFSVYHSRWEELEESDFHKDKTVQYGAEYRVKVAKAEKPLPDHGRSLPDDTLAMDYLERIIRECRDHNIQVILTYLPYPADDTAWEEVHSAQKIADSYNVDFINFLDADIVNLETDCCDSTSHLNPAGARKITRHIGEYLKQNCQLEDHRTDTDYSYWNDSCLEYEQMKVNYLNKQTRLEEFLMLLSDDDLDFVMRVTDKTSFESHMIRKLLENLGIDTGSFPDVPFELSSLDGNVTIDEYNPDDDDPGICIDVYYPGYTDGTVSTFEYD